MIAIAFLLFAALVLAWLAAPSCEASVVPRKLGEAPVGELASGASPALSRS